jgi:3-hydroxybutyryl-CoA dehydrogenase
MKIAVLGPGLMGAQIAVEYALGGHDVVALARRPDVAAERIEQAFTTLARHALATTEQLDGARQRLAIDRDPAAATDARIIVESVVEDLNEKAAALAPVMAVAPEAIIATNTSAIPISAIGAAINAPRRTIGAHYWNPPLLMPLVEVIRGAETSPEIATEMTTILRQLGKRPVLVDRDVPGFAWNRLQLALLREAVWLVENGVASPATVDEIVRDGLARRWRFTGPFQTAALGGAATFERVANSLWPELSRASSLESLRRWLDEDPATTTPLRERRDDGLVNELLHDRDPQSEATA